MTDLKIQILRGINTYTEDLIPKKHINLNARREFNINIEDLDVDDKVPNRSKIFAVYKPPKKKHIDIKQTDEKENNKEVSLNLEGNEAKPVEDKIASTVDLDLTSLLLADEPKATKNEPVKETKEDEFALTEDKLIFNKNVSKNHDVDPIDRAETETGGGESDSDDSLDQGRRKFGKKKKLTKEDFTDKFEKLVDLMKEKFDKDEMRERHERNMEKMKLGIETLVAKISNKKKAGSEASKSRKSSSECSDDSKVVITKESLNRLKGQIFTKATDEFVKNEYTKRCCFKVTKRKKRY